MLTIKDPSKVAWSDMPLNEMIKGNAMDVLFTLEIFEILEEELKKNGTYKLYEHIISPSLTIFADMEYNGFLIDENSLSELEVILLDRKEALRKKIYDNPYVKPDDNVASNADLSNILFLREDGLQLFPPVRTPKGAPSTNISCLDTLISQIEEELQDRGMNEKVV